MDNFTVWLKDAKQFADCVEPRAAADGWLSSLHFEEDCPKNLHHDGIVVCQVPPSLIFNCELSFIKDEKYKGCAQHLCRHLEKDLPPSLLMMSHLERHMKEAAEAMGFLQGVIRRSMSLSMAQWKSRRH